MTLKCAYINKNIEKEMKERTGFIINVTFNKIIYENS